MFLVTNYRIFLTRRTSCHAENHGWSRMSVMNFLFITKYRIFELILSITRRIAEVTDFLCPEFSNCRINTFNHTENRGRSRFFITNYRIIEFFLHTECRGRSRGFFFSRIIELFLHTECRRRSRIFLHTECWECVGMGDEEGWVLVFVCDS